MGDEVKKTSQNRHSDDDFRFENLEARVDDLFGERFFVDFMKYCDRYVALEAEYLGVNKDQLGEIEYGVYMGRLERFRKEELMQELVSEVKNCAKRENIPIKRVAASYLPYFSWTDEGLREHIKQRYTKGGK